MLASYSANYRDQFGEETTTIRNDGKTLTMVVRGVEFASTMLDDWESVSPDSDLSLFNLHHGMLSSFSLDFAISMPVVDAAESVNYAILQVHLALGWPVANNSFQLELTIEGNSFKSCGKHGWFEDELVEIHSQLPKGTFIKSCFTCAYSDYCPAGNGAFGCMACFRNTKAEYHALKGKDAYFRLMDKIAEFVQETYLCPEFERRTPGTGYRG